MVKTLLLRNPVGLEHRSKVEATNTGGSAVSVDPGISSGGEADGSSESVWKMATLPEIATSRRQWGKSDEERSKMLSPGGLRMAILPSPG